MLFLHKAKPKARQGKVFLVNASPIFEKGDPKNFIPEGRMLASNAQPLLDGPGSVSHEAMRAIANEC